jgi:hypothetical protein
MLNDEIRRRKIYKKKILKKRQKNSIQVIDKMKLEYEIS